MNKEIEKVIVEENELVEIIENPNEIVLSTGKKVTKRQRRGQHHIVEDRLLCACAVKGSGDGINIGDLILAGDIKTAVAIGEIDGTKVKIPTSLSEVYELAEEFSYEEWMELKLALQENQKELEEKAKKLQASIGLDSE